MDREKLVRAAAAVMVLVDGTQAELSGLTALGGARVVEALRRQLCEGPRPERAKALSAILTSIAVDLSDWGLR